jgi:hypothetical protein
VAWNLVDDIGLAAAPAATRRHFFVPLASIPVGQTAVRPVDRTMYTFTETYTTLAAPDGRTSDVSLNIQIQIPAGGLSDENGNPDPLIRLHAIDSARIHFEPAGAGLQDRLVMEMLTFGFLRTPLITGVPRWFGRWEDAQSVPLTLVYENVDRVQLEALLNGIAAPVDASILNRVGPTNGLHFPADVIQTTKANFVAQFLTGAANHFVYAETGSVIGTAAVDPADATRRLLKLRGRYQDHTAADPHPMNVRELFHLIFGDNSTEAQNHPLLVRLNETGQNLQAAIHPETKRFRLRPPLRTWKRVEWEADQEINAHQNDWAPAGNLGTNRFCNSHSRQDGAVTRTFNDGNYGGADKCNLFTSDICLRAGFCAIVHPVGANGWHFHDSNSHTNNIHRLAGADARIAATGSAADAARIWAWKIENALRAQAAADRQQFLNDAMQEEGRCFILSGARARRFLNHQVVPGVQGIANCATSLRRNGVGHIVIVEEVRAQPQMHATGGDGLQSIEVSTWEASGAGADSRNFNARLGGAAGAAAGGTGFIRLHLFELQPGGDPDTVQGLRSLNVQNAHRNLLGNANEAASSRRMTHTPVGVALPAPPAPGTCCQDNHPPSNAAPTGTVC